MSYIFLITKMNKWSFARMALRLRLFTFALFLGFLDVRHHATPTLNLSLGLLIAPPRKGVLTGAQFDPNRCAR